VRALDANGNVSPFSGAATASTLAEPTTPPPPPEPTTPSPSQDPAPEIMSVTLARTVAGCEVRIEVTVVASAPMSVELAYDVTGQPDGTRSFVFTSDTLAQTETLATADGTVDGRASATAGGRTDAVGWTACDPPPPVTTEPPSPEDDGGGPPPTD